MFQQLDIIRKRDVVLETFHWRGLSDYNIFPWIIKAHKSEKEAAKQYTIKLLIIYIYIYIYIYMKCLSFSYDRSKQLGFVAEHIFVKLSFVSNLY